MEEAVEAAQEAFSENAFLNLAKTAEAAKSQLQNDMASAIHAAADAVAPPFPAPQPPTTVSPAPSPTSGSSTNNTYPPAAAPPPTSGSSSSVHSPSHAAASSSGSHELAIIHNLKASWFKWESYLDEKLLSVPGFSQIQSIAHLHPSHVFLGLFLLAFFLVALDIGAKFICAVIGFAYPAFATFIALTRDPNESSQYHWLVYWMVFAALNLLETFPTLLLAIFPSWFAIKLLFFVWVTLPFTDGAQTVYSQVVRRVVAIGEFLFVKK